MGKIRFVLMLLLFAIVCHGDLPVTESLVAHLDGQHVIENGGVVDSMLDQSGNENHAVVEAAYPTYKPALASGAANGLDAVNFAGGKSLIIPGNEDFNVSELTIFIVYKYPDNPALNTNSYIVTGSHNIKDWSGVQWPFNSAQVRQTYALMGNDGKIKGCCRSKDGVWCGEMLNPFDGFVGWNLAVVVWDPDDGELSATIDGDVDMYVNPGSNRFPTLVDARNNRWYEGTDEGGNTFILENHIMTVLGGCPSYLVSPTYPGTYEISQGFGGMIAEVVIYSQALVECEIQVMVDYLQEKYRCGNNAPLLELPNVANCLYWQQRGWNDIADFNGDCKVDFADYSMMADNWLLSY